MSKVIIKKSTYYSIDLPEKSLNVKVKVHSYCIISFLHIAISPPKQHATTVDCIIVQQLVIHLLAFSIGFTPNRVPAMVIIIIE